MAIEIKTNIYFVVVKDSLIDEMDGDQKDLLERVIETKLTKVDMLKRNDEDYSLYLTYNEVPSVFLFRSDLLLEVNLYYYNGLVSDTNISRKIKAIRSKWLPPGISSDANTGNKIKVVRSRWFPSGISLTEYLEDEKFEEFRDETTVKFIEGISNIISNNTHKLVRPILERCINAINQDLSSGRWS